MYEEALKKLGFDEKEIAVFIAVIERGRVVPAIVAKVTGINRSTVYSIAKVLADRGILRIDTTNETAFLVIESSEVLNSLILREERELVERKSLVKDVIKQLENVPKSKHYSVPKVKFYDEKEIRDALHTRLQVWAESAINTKEPSWWGFQDVSMVENFPEWVIDYYNVASKDISTHLFTNSKKVEQEADKKISDDRRKMKYLEKEAYEFTATQVVLGDYVMLVMTSEKPFYMIEIHDRVMAHNLREVFKLMWGKF